MEPNNFDRYIRDQVRDAEKGLPEVDISKRERIWNAISIQLGPGMTRSWYKYAALILFLLLPSYWLVVQNTRQKRIISDLKGEIALHEKLAQTHNGQPAGKKEAGVTAIHDTIEIIRPGLIITQVDTFKIVEYIRDTVLIYNESMQAEQDISMAHFDKSDQPGVMEREQSSGETGITEIFLTENFASAGEKKTGKISSMKLVFGSKPQVQEFSPAVGTKL